MTKRPLSVVLLSWLLIVAGTVGIVYHVREFKSHHPFPIDDLGGAFIRVLAIVSGAFMLRRQNWARWLAVTWMAAHVVISAFHSSAELIIHAVLLVSFAVICFRQPADAYFRGPAPR